MEPKKTNPYSSKSFSESPMHEKNWQGNSYKRGFKRSPALRELDGAVGAYHYAMQTAADNHAERIKLSKNLLEKIAAWEASKPLIHSSKTGRRLAVDLLRQDTEAELSHLREQRAAERQQQREAAAERARQKKRAAKAAKKLGQKQKAAAFRPDALLVYSAGVLIDNSGAFSDASAQEYDTHRSYLTQKAAEGAVVSEADVRLAMLRAHLKKAYKHFQAQTQDDDSQKVLGLFTAPEWFFKQPNTPFTKQEQRYITKKCKKYSKKYPGMLVVPGSTVWTRNGGEKGDELELRATASAYFNGERVHRVHKRGMMFDECSYDPKTMPTAWERAQKTNQGSSLFLLGNRLLALDICGDHGRASREQYGKYGEEVGSDIHILVSKGMGFGRALVALSDGGIGIANDACVNPSGKCGVRSVFSGGSRVPNAGYYPGSNASPFIYAGEFHERKLSNPDELKELYMGRYPLPS